MHSFSSPLFFRFAASALVVLGIVACSPNVEQRGHPPLAEMEAELTPEVKTKEDVLRALGSPSTTSDFGPLTWYYISAERESQAFFAPETTRQEVLRIQFAEDGTIAKKEHVDMNDAQEVQISDRVTPTEGHQLGFVEQLMGNIGRYSSGAKKTGPKTLGRPGGNY